ncbi:MAG: tRNA (guanosine(46)-N7)-methyltransferase TrmB [Clostridia bacterium]|nr:tRNA (guanosine(46)-N7)-methyltransferase TrmB [Clostridia bacterium]
MRMRRKPNLDKRMTACDEIRILNPEEYKGRWRDALGFDRICLEIGCGKGKFITETAMNEPNTLFIAIERDSNVIVMAMEKALSQGIKNLRFMNVDAGKLTEYFDEGELNRIYLNFSDPWPKSKQAKRRLTHANFLTQYDKVLDDKGEIFFKTDNEKLFEFSLNEMSGYGLALSNITFDLHSTDYPNVVTEYEERFSSQGMRIYRVEARKRNV